MTVHDSAGESYGGALPSWPAYEPAAITDLEPSLAGWAARADDADEFALVVGVQRAQSDPESLLRVRALLSAGDASAAYRELGFDDGELPALGASFGRTELLAAACRAALGDDSAHRWLLHSSSLVVDHPMGWFATHLVAVVSDMRGDFGVADRAWRLLAERYNITTSHVVARLVAAHASERRDEDGAAVTRRFAQATTSLERTGHSIALDPRPTLAAVDMLCRRGDVGGARVLLEFVTRRNEVGARISRRLRELTPDDAMHRYRLMIRVALCLSPLLLFLGVPGLALFGAGVLAFRRWVAVPGLSLADSEAWRAAHRLRFDKRTGLPTASHPDGGWLGFAILAGGFAGLMIGAELAVLVSAHGTAAQTAAFVLPTAGLATLLFLLVDRFSRRRQDRARLMSRTERTRAALSRVGACQCWDTTVLADEVAQAYADRHLVGAGIPGPASTIAEALSHPAHVLRCPQLGTPWLLAQLTSEGSSLLLRGAVVTASSSDDAPTGQYL